MMMNQWVLALGRSNLRPKFGMAQILVAFLMPTWTGRLKNTEGTSCMLGIQPMIWLVFLKLPGRHFLNLTFSSSAAAHLALLSASNVGWSLRFETSIVGFSFSCSKHMNLNLFVKAILNQVSF
jgi:hypothetical protein